MTDLQVRISLRQAAILQDGSAPAAGGVVPPTGMKHSKSAHSLAEALSSLEQVTFPTASAHSSLLQHFALLYLTKGMQWTREHPMLAIWHLRFKHIL